MFALDIFYSLICTKEGHVYLVIHIVPFERAENDYKTKDITKFNL